MHHAGFRWTDPWIRPILLVLNQTLTSSHTCHPSCQNEWAAGCQQQQQLLQHKSAMGSSCQPPPTSSLLWIQMESQTKIIIKNKSPTYWLNTYTLWIWQKMLMALESIHYVCLILTVLRLLKRCFGASWPLQFFTYMLQLNSPSLQPARYTHSGRLLEKKSQIGHVSLCMCVCVSTFRQQ